MNQYFDQQWDQQLADNPEALRLFSSLDAAQQEKIVNYIQSCSTTAEASQRISQMISQLGAMAEPPEST